MSCKCNKRGYIKRQRILYNIIQKTLNFLSLSLYICIKLIISYTKLIPNTLLIAFTSILLISCSSDDDQPATEEIQNFLKVGDQEFELKSGIIEDFGSYQDLYNFDISLYSIETRVENNEIVPINDPEMVSAIYFELFTDNPDDLNVGSYEFDFSGTDEQNRSVNMYYKGRLGFIDATD